MLNAISALMPLLFSLGSMHFPAPAASPTVTQSDPSAHVIVRDNENETDYILVGVIANGGDANLDKLEAAAREAGAFPTPRTHEAGTTVGRTMVVFRPGSDVQRLRACYNRTREMEFGFVLIKVMVVAPADAKDGITSSDVKVRELADFAE